MVLTEKMNRMLLLAVGAAILAFAVPVLAVNFNAVDAKLYADGSISCSGADDLSDPSGKATLHPAYGGVYIKVKLNGAEPNRDYTVAVSKEPSCADPVFYNNVLHTNAGGDGHVWLLYPVSSGTYNLLVNTSTSAAGLTNPKHREIGTKDATITVP